MSNWRPIDTFIMPTTEEYDKGIPSMLVDNGERVGEAKLSADWGAWDGDEDSPPLRWAWTHHSTCSCCHSFMEPQPKWWQPLPAPAPRNEP
jgi:hypothetical protein